MRDLLPVLEQFGAGEAPLFAVLDGAQFDDLPSTLLLGGFVSRPLYRDRGIDDREQVVTAPQMVWLDEREMKADGRSAQETLTARIAVATGRPRSRER